MRRDTARVDTVMPPDVQVYPQQPAPPDKEAQNDHGGAYFPHDPETPPPTVAPTISLQRILLDCYEFLGLKEMLYFVLFFVSIVVFVWMQWSRTGAVFRSTIVESIRSWDPGDDWQSSQLKNLESVEDALQYYAGYLQSVQNKTNMSNLNSRTLWIGEYVEVSYIRLLADFGASCSKRRDAWRTGHNQQNMTVSECLFDAAERGGADASVEEQFRKSKRWQLPPGSGGANVLSATLFSKNLTTQEKWNLTAPNSLSTRLDEILELDQAVIGTYAAKITLEMLAINRIGRDAVVVSVSTGLKGWSNGFRLLTRMYVSTINTLKPKGSSPTPAFWVMLAFCLIASFFTLWLLRREAGIARLCKLQQGSLWVFFRYRWNQLQMVGLLLALAFIISFFVIMTQTSYGYDRLVFLMDDEEFVALSRDANRYTLWLYFGLALMGWEGMCMLRFMRVHGGLKTFYQVFTEAYKWLLDFFVFVFYVFVVLGLLVFGGFQISGGNPLFVEYGSGFSAMARLQFQLLSFDEFTSQYLGFGSRGGWVVELLFWATVIMMVVFVANILLAIFTTAYETARSKSLATEGSFLGLVIKRIVFTVTKVALDFVWFPFLHWVIEQRGNLEYTENDVRSKPDLKQRTFFEHLLDESKHQRKLMDRKWDLLQARWLLAQRVPLQTLVSFYTDFGTLKLIKPHERPQWRVITDADRSASGSGIAPIDLERFNRLVPMVLEELTGHEFLQLLMFLHEIQHRLQVRNHLKHVFVSGHHFHQLDMEVLTTIAEDVVRVYQYVPKPKRDLNRDGIDDDEDDPAVLLKRMRSNMQQLEGSNRDLQQQLGAVVVAMQQFMQAQQAQQGPVPRQPPAQQSSRRAHTWSEDV